MSNRPDPVPTDFVLTAIGTLQTTAKGNLYLPCETNRGKVAFWGTNTNKRNIELIRAAQPPVRLRCGCIPSNWSQHALWILQTEVLRLEGEQPAPPEGPASAPIMPTPVVSADDLSLWRRRLLRLLDRVEGSSPCLDGPVARITVLKRDGRIPRETAALMIALAELRNASEHQGKKPSPAEGAAARNAWLAICEWANSQGIDAERL